MKFWQKAFFAGLLLFLVGFDALGFTLARRSYELNAGYALQTALMEQGVIEKSLYDNIMNSAPQFTQLNSENLRFAVAPYAAYYKNQGVAMAVYLDGPAVYNGFPAYTPKGTGENEKAIVLQEINNNLFCVIESHLPAPLDTLVFIYAKDESALTAFRTDVTRLFLFISGIAAVLLGGALLFMLIGLTRPFRKLSAAAAEISGGDY
ncbi:MAG: hypothetical protein LBT44_08880, partial [Clostridiales bacterium]|nr:hypothetical protein [Clostridiales bacterium]